MCYLRPDSLLAALIDDLVYLCRLVELKVFQTGLKAGWAYTNNKLAMANAAIGAMNFCSL